MTPEQFTQQLAAIPIELQRWCNNDAPRIAGKTAVDIYTRNFQRQGFVNNGLQPWQEVKRRTDPKVTGAAASRPILTGATGNLGRAFDYTTGIGLVTIYNDARSARGFPYAQVHNTGVSDAGRSRSVVIPRRQLIGYSAEMDRMIQMEINRKMRQVSGG